MFWKKRQRQGETGAKQNPQIEMLLGYGAVSVRKLTALKIWRCLFICIKVYIKTPDWDFMCQKSRSKVCGLNLFLVFCCFSFQETLGENKLRDTLCNDKLINFFKKEGETRTAPPFSLIGANNLLVPVEQLIFLTAATKQLYQSSCFYYLTALLQLKWRNF